MQTSRNNPVKESPASRIWVLAKVDYDEYSIVGVYDAEEKAEAGRQEITDVNANELHGPQTAPIARAELKNYQISSFPLNETLLWFRVERRKDGTVTEAQVFTGDSYNERQTREATYTGAGRTLAAALADAEQRVAEETRAAKSPS